MSRLRKPLFPFWNPRSGLVGGLIFGALLALLVIGLITCRELVQP